MANYFEMTRDELTAEKAALEEKYKKFQAMGLKLNMARGKPGPHQICLLYTSPSPRDRSVSRMPSSA